MGYGYFGRAARTLLQRRETWIATAVILTAVSYWGISQRPDRELAGERATGAQWAVPAEPSSPVPPSPDQPRRFNFRPDAAPARTSEPVRAAHAVFLAVEPAESSEVLNANAVQPAAWESVTPSPQPAWLTGEIEIVD